MKSLSESPSVVRRAEVGNLRENQDAILSRLLPEDGLFSKACLRPTAAPVTGSRGYEMKPPAM